MFNKNRMISDTRENNKKIGVAERVKDIYAATFAIYAIVLPAVLCMVVAVIVIGLLITLLYLN